jgi:hypothetical protein
VVALVDGILALPIERRALVRLASQEMVNLDFVTRQAFSEVYEEKFIGRIAQMFEQGMQRGELRQMDAHVVTWTLLGMLYPFFSFSTRRSAVEEKQMVAQMLDIFFEGVLQHGT